MATTASLLVPPRLQILDANGEPLVGGQVFTYDAGTTNPRNTYTDYNKSATNTNPVILDDYGMANIWLDGAYQIIVTVAGGSPLVPEDIVYSADDVIAYSAADFTGLTASIADLNSTTTTAILTSVNYTVTIANRGETILVNAASAPINVILPSCVTVGSTYKIIIKKIDLSLNPVNLVTISSQTIDGKYPYALYDYNDFVEIQSDGSNWQIVSARIRGVLVTITDSQDITLENEDNYFLCNASSGNLTLSLDPSATLGNGYTVGFKKIDVSSNTITVVPDGAEQIDGISSLVLSGTNEAYTIRCTGSGWFIVSASSITGIIFTGIMTPYVGLTAPAGWVLAGSGSIGDASSGGTARANADTQNLFILTWNSISDTWCAVSGGRGVDALTDFNAHKAISLPRVKGRVIGGAGTGTGLTARDNGEYMGQETRNMELTNLVPHAHTVTAYGEDGGSDQIRECGTASGFSNPTTSSVGSGWAAPLMQPSTFITWIIKL